MISVLMSVYKEPIDWLKQSIDSILNQTFTDFEFIIVCDNPQYEKGIGILKEYATKDSRIVLLFNKENIGLTKSLNKGLAIAKGQYIARMDADDISSPERFERQYHYLEDHPDVIVLGTNIKYIGKKLPIKGNDSIKFDDDAIKAQMLFVNCIAHSSVFIRNSVLKAHSIFYDENYRQSQDYRLWEILIPYGKFSVLPEKLLKYRVSRQQITKSQTQGQSNLAGSVRLRFQRKWLEKVGCKSTNEELENYPFRIINRLRNSSKVNRSPEYRAFLQYAYLLSGDKTWTLFHLFKYDIWKMPLLSVLRLVKKMI